MAFFTRRRAGSTYLLQPMGKQEAGKASADNKDVQVWLGNCRRHSKE